MESPAKLAVAANLLPHLDAAHTLARGLVRNDSDARDMVQEACLRALRFMGGFRGEDPRAWLLAIVRNTCYSWLRQNRMTASGQFDDQMCYVPDQTPGPAALLVQRAAAEEMREALETLPTELREILTLHELEELSYREIAAILGIPLGTVMSRLFRARAGLRRVLIFRRRREMLPAGRRDNAHARYTGQSHETTAYEMG